MLEILDHFVDWTIHCFSESRANIVGSRDLYMNERSEVELLCRIENSPGPPAYIYWYKVMFWEVLLAISINQLRQDSFKCKG